MDDLIEHTPADVVIVSTSNSDHFATTAKLLRAGRPVMVEKPICENRKDLNELLALARAANIFFHAALHAAFARDLLWWLENRQSLTQRFGPIERFHMDFFDSYIENNGSLSKSARGLGGSWYDSGINALSVLACLADPASIKLLGAQMHLSPRILREQISGSAMFACQAGGGTCTGQINTNWVLGLDHKTTSLSCKRAKILLDHSSEQVVIQEDRQQPEIISLRNGLPRLTNHYVGVFRDLESSFARQEDNSGLAAQLHALLFDAVDAANGEP